MSINAPALLRLHCCDYVAQSVEGSGQAMRVRGSAGPMVLFEWYCISTPCNNAEIVMHDPQNITYDNQYICDLCRIWFFEINNILYIIFNLIYVYFKIDIQYIQTSAIMTPPPCHPVTLICIHRELGLRRPLCRRWIGQEWISSGPQWTTSINADQCYHFLSSNSCFLQKGHEMTFDLETPGSERMASSNPQPASVWAQTWIEWS